MKKKWRFHTKRNFYFLIHGFNLQIWKRGDLFPITKASHSTLPLYFCSNTCLSPVSKPLNLERKEIRLKCYSNIPEAVLNPKLLQIGSSISARTEDKSWDQNVH